MSGDSVGAFDMGVVVIGGAGLLFLPVGNLTAWTIVPFRVCGILKAVNKGGQSMHFRIRGGWQWQLRAQVRNWCLFHRSPLRHRHRANRSLRRLG